jgi:putative Mg2+ transporter-C (MgtC) family protein
MTAMEELLLVLRLIIAAALGAMIGMERERHGRRVGIRTFAAVSLGACAFSIISYVVVPEGNETTRIAAQVVSGIGFLGAGVILRSHGHISGLTTAASLWATAAVGMAIGYGLLIFGTAIAVLLLLLLLLRSIAKSEQDESEKSNL